MVTPLLIKSFQQQTNVVSGESNLKSTQQANFEDKRNRIEFKKKVEEDVFKEKFDQAKMIKKLSKVNERKKSKFLKRVQSENQLKGQIIKQQE